MVSELERQFGSLVVYEVMILCDDGLNWLYRIGCLRCMMLLVWQVGSCQMNFEKFKILLTFSSSLAPCVPSYIIRPICPSRNHNFTQAHRPDQFQSE